MITDHTKLCMEKICRPFPVHHLDMPPILNFEQSIKGIDYQYLRKREQKIMDKNQTGLNANLSTYSRYVIYNLSKQLYDSS